MRNLKTDKKSNFIWDFKINITHFEWVALYLNSHKARQKNESKYGIFIFEYTCQLFQFEVKKNEIFFSKYFFKIIYSTRLFLFYCHLHAI